MTKQAFGPSSPSPYSSGLLAGPYAFVSGQIARDAATGEIAGGSVAEQTEMVIDNLESVLAGVGLGLADIVKTTVFLTDMATFEEMNAVYRRRFPGAAADSLDDRRQRPREPAAHRRDRGGCSDLRGRARRYDRSMILGQPPPVGWRAGAGGHQSAHPRGGSAPRPTKYRQDG